MKEHFHLGVGKRQRKGRTVLSVPRMTWFKAVLARANDEGKIKQFRPEKPTRIQCKALDPPESYSLRQKLEAAASFGFLPPSPDASHNTHIEALGLLTSMANQPEDKVAKKTSSLAPSPPCFSAF